MLDLAFISIIFTVVVKSEWVWSPDTVLDSRIGSAFIWASANYFAFQSRISNL